MEYETDDLVSDGIAVVEGGEGIEEWRDEEMGVEGAEVVEQKRVWDGLGDLREGVGDVEWRRCGTGDKVGEAEEADAPALCHPQMLCNSSEKREDRRFEGRFFLGR
eukprot:TRINITY_DN11351_c0_g1_i6.p2 TRINITY_DN11351_c0_g1~~TRINITY_DN11351_c0_g1_i6.p2  ORF type:complete len:106 (+),score=35.31 TRINITY_DN11351_c0_g1_i6:730-1047(+)